MFKNPLQSILVKTTMPNTSFKSLADLCLKLENTSKRNNKISLISEFLKSLNPYEVYPAVLLIVGSIFPEFDDRTLDAGWKTLQRIVKTGRQTSLFREEVSISHVHKTLYKVANQSGTGSKKLKNSYLRAFLMILTPPQGRSLLE